MVSKVLDGLVIGGLFDVEVESVLTEASLAVVGVGCSVLVDVIVSSLDWVLIDEDIVVLVVIVALCVSVDDTVDVGFLSVCIHVMHMLKCNAFHIYKGMQAACILQSEIFENLANKVTEK